MLACVQSLLLSNVPWVTRMGPFPSWGVPLAQGEPASYSRGVEASTPCPSATLRFFPLSAHRALPESCTLKCQVHSS